MEGTASLSKGCFLFKPQSCTSNKVLSGCFQTLAGETAGDTAEREKCYREHWSGVKRSIEGMMEKLHDQLLGDLLQFVEDSSRQLHKLSPAHSSSDSNDHGCSATEKEEKRCLPPRLEIPTAVLIAGVNMLDHECLFRQLKLRICASVSPHVVQLQSATCNAGMKATWKEILQQLLDSPSVEVGEEEDSAASHQRLPLASLPLLCSWYQGSLQDSAPKRKKRKLEAAQSHHARPPVVIIAEDFEGFAPQILQDLFMSLSPHLAVFPVVLVLGVATSATAIHSLPRASSSLLCVEQFRAQPSIDTLTQLIHEVLLSPGQPFRLGPQALHLLLHQFLCSSLSATRLSLTLQVAMLEHFHWQPLSVLISRWDGLNSTVDGLNHNHCEMIRATPSFRKYVESVEDPEQQILILEDDDILKEVAKEQLHRVRVHQYGFPPLLRCLHVLTENLPCAPLGRKLHDLYMLCMEGHVTELSQFNTAWNLLRVVGREGFSAAVRRCISILEDSLREKFHGDRDEHLPVPRALLVFREFVTDLERLDRPAQQFTAEEEREEEGEGVVLGDAQTTSERKMKFQERLRQIASRKKEPSVHEKAQGSLLDGLLQILQEGLAPPQTLPLHEVCYFNNASSLRKHLAAAPRASLHVALTKPTFYLPSANSVSEQSGLSPHMPDVCIAYQLHLECGRLINLFDWLCSFVAVVDPQVAEGLANRERGRGTKDDIDPTLHARFIQAVSELQLLGFVKPTQRKTDHVQRLTWGAC